MIDHDNLEEFADPHTYDLEDDSDTGIAFYTALVQETGGPVLEIACGTGRGSIPIARLGLAVTGLDIVPGMLGLAARKSAGLPTRWVEVERARARPRRAVSAGLPDRQRLPGISDARRPRGAAGTRARAPARREPVRLRDP